MTLLNFILGLSTLIPILTPTLTRELLIVLLATFTMRETFQMIISFKRYFSAAENWIEIAMIVTGNTYFMLKWLKLKTLSMSYDFCTNAVSMTYIQYYCMYIDRFYVYGN